MHQPFINRVAAKEPSSSLQLSITTQYMLPSHSLKGSTSKHCLEVQSAFRKVAVAM